MERVWATLCAASFLEQLNVSWLVVGKKQVEHSFGGVGLQATAPLRARLLAAAAAGAPLPSPRDETIVDAAHGWVAREAAQHPKLAVRVRLAPRITAKPAHHGRTRASRQRTGGTFFC